MRSKILGGIVVLILAVVVAFNVSLKSKTDGLSDVALANIEALAIWEFDPNLGWLCFWEVKDDTNSEAFFVCQRCGDCYTVSATFTASASRCWH